ncbi:hypothetical protein CCACVL1_06941, partial [Corchorus capsularis]
MHESVTVFDNLIVLKTSLLFLVGYIVGLDDRHTMNILINQATAEVVHIDLGVAFEQGLMLKTPFPFTLTRDIVDGMSVAGVEGIFRRCCEETLSVMRTDKEALLTIIEVFIHDPLYKWALSPLKALQCQKETDDDLDTSLEGSQDEYEGNKDGTRALLRVKQKLDGYEDGEMRSVHGQVQQLIQDAIDPKRLYQMFPGWGAWMEGFRSVVLSLDKLQNDGKQLAKGGSNQMNRKQLQQKVGLKPSLTNCIDGLVLLHEMHLA